MDKLTSFHFNEIELDCECDTDLQFCDSEPLFESILTPVSLSDLDPIPEPILIPVPIDFVNEPPILDSHIHLMDHDVNLSLYLEPTLEPNWTLEPILDLKPKFFEPIHQYI